MSLITAILSLFISMYTYTERLCPSVDSRRHKENQPSRTVSSNLWDDYIVYVFCTRPIDIRVQFIEESHYDFREENM